MILLSHNKYFALISDPSKTQWKVWNDEQEDVEGRSSLRSKCKNSEMKLKKTFNACFRDLSDR